MFGFVLGVVVGVVGAAVVWRKSAEALVRKLAADATRDVVAQGGTAAPQAAPGTIDRTSPAYVQWLQVSLNKVLGGTPLVPLTGVMDQATRQGLAKYEQQKGLQTDGRPDAEVEATLMRDGASAPPLAGEFYQAQS